MSQTRATSQTALPRLHFRVPPEPAHLLRARERLRDYLRQYCTERQAIDDVVLCVEEACTNAIRHGGSPDDIEIALHFSHARVVATVKDRGRGFDLASFDPDGRPDPLLDHGRGLFIMGALMDSLELRIDGGLEVRMARKVGARRTSAPLDSGLGERVAGSVGHREARTRALLEEIDEAFVALDWEYRYIYANAHACRLLGRPRDEMLGNKLSALFPKLRGSELERGFRAAMELGRPSAMEWHSPILDAWVETRIYPTSTGVTAYFHDISQRKRKEEERDELLAALQRNQNFLDGVLGSITDNFVTLDQNWQFTFANEAAAAIFEIKPAELIGKKIWDVVPDAVGNDAYVALHTAMAERRTIEFNADNRAGQRSYHALAYPLADGGLAVLVHETTERRRVEAALQDAEAKAQDLIRYAPTAIFEIDFREPAFRVINDAMCALSGYSREELLTMNPFDLLDAESQAVFAERIRKALGGEPIPESVEYRFKTKDGRLRDVTLDTSFTYTDGVVDGALVVGYDMTERKQAQAELRASEERFRSLFESTTEGIALHEVIYDEDGRALDYRIIDVNPSFESQTGLLAGDARGRLASELYGTGEAPYLTEYVRLAEGGAPSSFETYFEPMARHFHITVISPARGRFATIFEDITERKRIEEERRQEAALRYARRLIESSLDPLVTISAEGKITDVNDATERITGLGRDELIGSDFSDYFTEPEQARAGYRQVFAEGSVVDYPLAIRHSDGSVRDVLYNASLYRNEAGEVAGVFAAARDITERKRAEQEALENARRFEEQKRIAVTLQENLIHPLPAVDGLQLGVVSQTANEPELVGGDLSDVFVVDDAHVVVLVGDVAGKGVHAAGMTETVRSTVRALATIDPSPSFVLAKTNELLLRFDPGESHVTAFLVVIDPKTGHMTYASAGHPAPVHLGAFTCLPLDVTFGPPLGTFERPYKESHAMLTLEDYLVLYTDGVTEARRDGELLGERRLLEIVAGLRGRSAQEVADGIRDAALDYARRLRDDLQVVVLRLA